MASDLRRDQPCSRGDDANLPATATATATGTLGPAPLARSRRRKALCGDAWIDQTGLLFTEPDGTPLHPANITDIFVALVAEAGLPPIRLHDLRHGAATLALTADVDIKVVQVMLGHSSHAITANTYTRVLPQAAHHAAEATAAIVPRATIP